MSTKMLRLAALVGLAAASVAAVAAAPDFKEGQWAMQYSMEVTGMPFKMPSITGKRSACLTGKNYVPDNSQAGQQCQTKDVKVNGNTVTWTMQCKTQEGSIEGQGRVTYKGDRYDGGMDAQMISMTMSGAPINYRYTMQGEREGDCKK
jgi:Protein of unknown function (DUF3617)